MEISTLCPSEALTEQRTKQAHQTVKERANERRKMTWMKKRGSASQKATAKKAEVKVTVKCINMKATYRPETLDRLYNEALASPAYQGMSPDEIKDHIHQQMEKALVSSCGRPYPWWWGRLEIDKPKQPPTIAQTLALSLARERKAQIKLEASQPYQKEQHEIQ